VPSVRPAETEFADSARGQACVPLAWDGTARMVNRHAGTAARRSELREVVQVRGEFTAHALKWKDQLPLGTCPVAFVERHRARLSAKSLAARVSSGRRFQGDFVAICSSRRTSYRWTFYVVAFVERRRARLSAKSLAARVSSGHRFQGVLEPSAQVDHELPLDFYVAGFVEKHRARLSSVKVTRALGRGRRCRAVQMRGLG
jgi:hypothetical protein